jgi:hypothetical protein
MNNILKKKILGVIVGVFMIFLLAASHVLAAIGLDFGGYVEYWGYGECDCPLTILNLPAYFLPEFSSPPAAIPAMTYGLVYSPYTTIVWSNYNVGTPGIYSVGKYIPGAQACYYYIFPYECGLLETGGVLTEIGTSPPTSPGGE